MWLEYLLSGEASSQKSDSMHLLGYLQIHSCSYMKVIQGFVFLITTLPEREKEFIDILAETSLTCESASGRVRGSEKEKIHE